MGKKKFRFVFDSPFILIFVALSTLIFFLDKFALKGKALDVLFSCPGARGADTFNFTNPLHYLRLIVHPLGNGGTATFFTGITALLLLGPQMENRFGIPMLALMSGISALVSGVLNACLGPATISGPESIIFLLIFLCATVSVMKRSWDISQIATFIAYGAFVLFSTRTAESPFTHSLIHLAIAMAGGLCGGALGFLVAPKAVKEKSTATKSTAARETTKVDRTQGKTRGRRKIKKAVIDDVPTETEVGTL